MGLWECIAIVTAFSIFVIVADEIMHARRRKRREERGEKLPGGH
jgi:hypothetical protein